jgi:hypothetical protein
MGIGVQKGTQNRPGAENVTFLSSQKREPENPPYHGDLFRKEIQNVTQCAPTLPPSVEVDFVTSENCDKPTRISRAKNEPPNSHHTMGKEAKFCPKRAKTETTI